jgi:hypothetical protein
MAEFHDFAGLGRLFQQAAFAYSGKAAVARGFSGFAPASKAGGALGRALHDSGEAMKAHFQQKILTHGGSDHWAPLEETWTQQERGQAGLHPDDPLFATGQMHDAIDYEVHGLDVKVGIHDGDYDPPGYGSPRSLEYLFDLAEHGFHAVNPKNDAATWVDPRPIFTGTDFYPTANAVAEAFAETAIVNGLLKNLSR